MPTSSHLNRPTYIQYERRHLLLTKVLCLEMEIKMNAIDRSAKRKPRLGRASIGETLYVRMTDPIRSQSSGVPFNDHSPCMIRSTLFRLCALARTSRRSEILIHCPFFWRQIGMIVQTTHLDPSSRLSEGPVGLAVYLGGVYVC